MFIHQQLTIASSGRYNYSVRCNESTNTAIRSVPLMTHTHKHTHFYAKSSVTLNSKSSVTLWSLPKDAFHINPGYGSLNKEGRTNQIQHSVR